MSDRCWVLFGCLLVGMLNAGSIGAQIVDDDQKDGDPMELFEPREFAGDDGQVLRYRLLKPTDFDPSHKYPLVVFLHGAGERGDDNLAQLKHGAREFCTAARRKDFPCYVLAPQCPENEKWADVDWSAETVEFPAKASPSLTLVFQLLDQMLETASIDKDRIYITGLSMGGYGTWDALVRRPNFFAAALPICGGADPRTADKIAEIPVWCFHGGDDQVVVVENSRTMIAALQEAGGQPKYTEYPGVGHDSWTATYANDEHYTWLFSQHK